MRVLAVTNLYPNPYQPHRATFNRHQLRILGTRTPVQVIAPIAWTDELSARRKQGKLIPKNRRLSFDGLTVDHPCYYFPPRVLRSMYGKCYAQSVKGTFRRATKEFQPDVVFTPWAYPDGWAMVKLGHAAGLPVVVQVHGSDILLLKDFPARKKRTIEAVTGADAVVAVSQDLKYKLIEMGVAAERVRVVYDGVDRTIFHPGSQEAARTKLNLPAHTKQLLFIGNLVPVKAIDVLIEAVLLLHKQGEAFHLNLIGQGPLRPILQGQIDRLGLSDKVTMHGAKPQNELPDWYRASDLFLLPSHSEGVPNVLLEASASGIPYVASRVGGIPEIADRGHGLLVPPAQPESLATAIKEKLHASKPEPIAARDRADAVTELQAFLQQVLDQHRKK